MVRDSAQQQRRMAPTAVHRAEAGVNPQPRRQDPNADYLIRTHGVGRLRKETHCGQGEYAAHRHPNGDFARAHPDHLLIEQRSRRTVNAAVLLRQLRPALGEIQQYPGRNVVDVGEA